MADRHDIDGILSDWPYEPGEISVRLVHAQDGREVLQMRVDMGVLQLEVEGRPDGERPGGAATYFDFLVAATVHEGDGFLLDEAQCAETDREFMQFYYRRICWLALREYRRAMRDADHTLALMELLKSCAPDEEWLVSHEQYVPFILFHRTQAAALAELEDHGADKAIEAFNDGLDRMRAFFDAQDASEQFDEDEIVARLIELRETLREQYDVGLTLPEQLADAVASERYELAARLRDEIARRGNDRKI